MAADPSAVYCMEKYGNYEQCKGAQGTHGVVRLPDGKLYDTWYIYRKEKFGETDREQYLDALGIPPLVDKALQEKRTLLNGGKVSEIPTIPEKKWSGPWTIDREPQPTDGPDYHADHKAWERRQVK